MDSESVSVQFRVDLLDPSGRFLSHDDLFEVSAGDLSSVSVRQIAVADLTNDGTADLFLVLESWEYEAYSESEALILSAEGDTIVEVPLPVEYFIESLSDWDEDGRGDLIVHPYRRMFRSCGPSDSVPEQGPSFLAHNAAEGFTLNDEATSNHARTWCPAPPTTYLTSELDSTFANVVCGHIWGVDAEAISASLSESCAAFISESAEEGFHPCQDEICMNLEALGSVYEEAPPLSLQ